MARVERILAIDIGATSIKVGEFEYPPKEGPALVNFTYREYEEELTEGSRSIVVAGLLRQMLVENNFVARKALLSISGQSAFTRFVKLPPVAEEESRVKQIVEFEARQNVPFPMEEVVWDYQLIANPESEEMDVMFVVVKNDIVEQMTGAVQAVGLEPLLVDVAPAACYNAARANHIGDEDCAMVLNIGGRSTNLLFADRSRFFARTIPIAGHSITQQIGKEFGIGFAEAEELKRRHGFVALGGAYAEPESEVAAAVSKIIRNVMARLHGEINRSISVYRAHQKGNRPVTLYLTGGSSTMTYTDHFFAEKLRMEVNYLNPFQVVNLGPTVNRQQLQEVAHMFSEVVGLGLRYRLQCPVEVTLIPENIRRQQALKKKKPYFMACLACLVLVLAVALLANQRRATLYRDVHERMQSMINRLDRLNQQIMEAQQQTQQRRRQYDSLKTFLESRTQWPNVLNELNRVKPKNVWLVTIQPLTGDLTAEQPAARRGRTVEGEDAFMDEMMFPGAMLPGAQPGVARVGQKESVKISGLEISGHSVMLESDEEAVMPAPPDIQKEETQEPKKDAEDQAAPAEGDTREEPPAPIRTALGSVIPEEAFLANLRASELFDADPQLTTIKTYIAPNLVRNLSSFTIQIKFTEPIEFFRMQ